MYAVENQHILCLKSVLRWQEVQEMKFEHKLFWAHDLDLLFISTENSVLVMLHTFLKMLQHDHVFLFIMCRQNSIVVQ